MQSVSSSKGAASSDSPSSQPGLRKHLKIGRKDAENGDKKTGEDHAIQHGHSRKHLREKDQTEVANKRLKNTREKDQTEFANKRLKNTAEDPPTLPIGRVNMKMPDFNMMSESLKAELTDCAILAMKDHAIQNKGYREGLKFVKISKVRWTLVAGNMYDIIFEGVSKMHGVTTYKAVVVDGIVRRMVKSFSTIDPLKDDWKSGVSCIPLISITDASSSDNMSSEKAIVRDCAILAMQDHAIQEYCLEGLRFIKLQKWSASLVGRCSYFYSIKFLGASTKHGEVFYKAYVWDGKVQRKILYVRIIGPHKGRRYTGMLCIPKVACLLK